MDVALAPGDGSEESQESSEDDKCAGAARAMLCHASARRELNYDSPVFLNIRRRSVVGLSLDYQILNAFGFTCYFLFNALLFWSPGIRGAYRQSHHGQDSAVRLNDVVFAGHALLVTLVTLAQIGIYYDYPPLAGSDRLLRFAVLAALGLVGLFMVGAALYIGAYEECCLSWLTFLTITAEVKVAISVVKYCPQVWMNYKRKSTAGWTIYNVLLDFTGGLLSVAQLLLDASLSNDWSKVSGDPAKLMLGNVSVFFDIIFIVQHFCLYRDASRGRALCDTHSSSSEAL
ncbi:CTNS [Symbiodinium natans]|uniref:CTNS protein n=1 Tax=Symbiodinium natans TaxID=878477 RepID=A0A812V7Z3_9DINO|nr:CTNS [Symbiodinium natans]